MGNGMSPCLRLSATAEDTAAAARLVYWGGRTRLLTVTDDDGVDGRCCSTAGEVAAELPQEHVVCPGDCFFVGLPIPVMSPGERLLPGWTYFVLPAARFSSLKVLTAATLASLSPEKKVLSLAECPFEYVKGVDGAAALIRVLPEFIEKVITCDDDGRSKVDGASTAEVLCSTPELKRHYAQLVGPRNRSWSPRLETISECNSSNKKRMLRSAAKILSSR